MKLCEILPLDTCPNCKGKHTIELYDRNNNPLHYSRNIVTDNKNLIKAAARYFKCIKCNQLFNIIWKDDFPETASELNFFEFMNTYKGGKTN